MGLFTAKKVTFKLKILQHDNKPLIKILHVILVLIFHYQRDLSQTETMQKNKIPIIGT